MGGPEYGDRKVPDCALDLVKMFCGCYLPEEAWGEIRGQLERWPRTEYSELSPKDQFIVYYLNDVGLLEHGGSIGGCWKTEKGKALLEFLQAEGDGWLDSGPRWYYLHTDGEPVYCGGIT